MAGIVEVVIPVEAEAAAALTDSRNHLRRAASEAGHATAQDALDSIGVPADQLRSVVPA